MVVVVVVVDVLRLFLTVLWVDLQCVIVVFPDHTHFLMVLPRDFRHLIFTQR